MKDVDDAYVIFPKYSKDISPLLSYLMIQIVIHKKVSNYDTIKYITVLNPDLEILMKLCLQAL